MSYRELIEEAPFSYFTTKNGLVQIAYNGKTVTTLSAKEASRFLNKVASGDDNNAQLVMAKATGHFKHGTEKTAKQKER